MRKVTILGIGIITTAAIYFSATLLPDLISWNNDFIPKSFLTHSIMLLFSLVAIIYFNKRGLLKFEFKPTKIKFYFYAILFTFGGIILAQIIVSILLIIFGFEMDPSGKGHAIAAAMNSVQIFLFIFIYASICEEILFRGFVQNILNPLSSVKFKISKKVFVGLPVLISGVLFGLGHLILLSTDTSGPMIFRIVITTSIIGIIAGYFQEKHKTILIAIIIHMAANLPALIGSIVI